MIVGPTCHPNLGLTDCTSVGLPRKLLLAVALGASLTLALAVLADDARADGNSTSNSRATSRTPSAGQMSTPDATRPEMIVLPWFLPGSTNQPITAAPAAEPQTQTSAPTPSSVIQLPAFYRSTPSAATPYPVTPNAGNPPPARLPPTSTIPEIDPASAANALTLLIGGVIMLTDRRRRICCC